MSDRNEPIRVLTIFQPWASLVMAGAKPFEFRKNRPPRTIIDQRVVIHAAARKVDRREVLAIMRALEAGGDDAARTCLKRDLAMPVLERAMATEAFTDERQRIDLTDRGDLPWGSGLGTAVCGEGRNGIEIAETEFGLSVPEFTMPTGFNPASGAENPFDDDDDELGGMDSDRREHANWGWPLTDIEAWPVPIPARGNQGIWFWPSPASAAL